MNNGRNQAISNFVNACALKHETSSQPFPESGPLARSKNLRLGQLKKQAEGHTASGSKPFVYAYIVRTADIESGPGTDRFAQKGSAPNFQGGCITLCTCKHGMRASRKAEDWRGNWIAGFTTHRAGKNYLFYLMRVEGAFESFRRLWESNVLSARARKAKSASIDALGDLFRPLGKGNEFSARSYEEPMNGHSHRCKGNWTAWHKDIEYQSRPGGHPALIVGDRRQSFLWTKPLIYFSKPPFRNHRRYHGVHSFFDDLRECRSTP